MQYPRPIRKVARVREFRRPPHDAGELRSSGVFCPQCRDEFRDGISKCPDCDVHLVRELPEEQAARLKLVEMTRDSDRLAVLLEQLENAQVPYVVEAGTALSLIENEEAPELSFPDEWKARLFVPGNFAARAEEAIAEIPAAAPAANGKEAAAPVEPEEAEALDPDALKNPVQPR